MGDAGEMQTQSAPRDRFLRAVAAWSLVFWVAVYAVLTIRSLFIGPDLPFLSLAGLRVLMIPLGLLVCAVLFILLERIARFDRLRKAAAAAAMLALATVLYFTINYYVFHGFPQQGVLKPNPLIKIASYLVEFFWIFPAWALLYLFLRWRFRTNAPLPLSQAPVGIWVKDRGSQILVPADGIRWIEAERDYARIHTDEGSHLVRSTMAALEQQLRGIGLVRIHRRIIVPAHAIRAVNRSRDGRAIVTLEGGIAVPAGRSYLPRLQLILGGDAAVQSNGL